MKDKFVEYYSNENRIQELSQYVHENFKLIHTKMISELRRKLDIEADITNKDGYVSLMATLYVIIFNEFVYGLSGISQHLQIPVTELINPQTLKIFLDLYEGKNPFVPVLGYFTPDTPNYAYKVRGIVRDMRDAQYLFNRRINGRMRSDVKDDLEGFKNYYLENIDELREVKEALPKDD